MTRFDYIAGPSFLASALVNGDESSLESAADKAALAKFLADLPDGASVEDLRRDADGQVQDSHFMHWRFPEGTLGCDGAWYLIRLPDGSAGGWEPVKAADLRPGDKVDLEGDPYADKAAKSDDGEFSGASLYEFELAPVIGYERETEGCVRIDFESASVGFPPDHCLRVVERDRETGRQLGFDFDAPAPAKFDPEAAPAS